MTPYLLPPALTVLAAIGMSQALILIVKRTGP